MSHFDASARVDGLTPAATVLLAGSTGVLGRRILSELRARGYGVRCLTRRASLSGDDRPGDLLNRASLAEVCRGIDVVISAAGASMRLDNWGDRTAFEDVDWHGNCHLLERAIEGGVRKFIYVSLAHGPRFLDTEYARAHERFVGSLKTSGMEFSIIRPTGFFGFNVEILNMARKGRAVIIGDGKARTNPIHEADVARACVDAISVDARDLPVGGPQIFTRREVAELAFRVLDRAPRITSVPGWFGSLLGRAAGLANRRMGALFTFGAAVSQVDVIAPAYGVFRLEDYFREALTR
jgi:uncharacterized protein YbjT (DUF2867 family)